MQNLVSVDWLRGALNDKDLVVLYTDMASIVTGEPMPKPPAYIPGSRYFDFEDSICDHRAIFPHTLPSAALFEREVGKLGICPQSKIVVYDAKGIYCSARVWWMFKVMGHKDVAVLDGGLPAWLEQRLETEPCEQRDVTQVCYGSQFNQSWLTDAEAILGELNNTQQLVIDARSSARFYAEAPEPREGVRAGHIPNAVNLPFAECLADGKLKSPAELAKLFDEIGANSSQQLVFSCGSGVTACILALAANQCGYPNLSVFDGSWTEWGSRNELPVEV